MLAEVKLMGLAQPASYYYTIDEYLDLERAAAERHEYLDGEIYAMAGESLAHSDICVNLAVELGAQLKGRDCRVTSPNMKVRSGPYIKQQKTTKGLYSYPDLAVVCGEPQFQDEHRDTLLNPTVIIEVLSPSTEAFDRREKLMRYRAQLPTLRDYLLVAQNEPAIEHFHFNEAGYWQHTVVIGLGASLYLESIDCALNLSEVYDRVEFLPAPAELER
jgi:Uma2 family endonuclease